MSLRPPQLKHNVQSVGGQVRDDGVVDDQSYMSEGMRTITPNNFREKTDPRRMEHDFRLSNQLDGRVPIKALPSLDIISMTPSRLEYGSVAALDQMGSPEHHTVQDKADIEMLRQAEMEGRRRQAVQTINQMRLEAQLPQCEVVDNCTENAV